MTDNVISLNPTMQQRMNFDHELLNNVNDWKLEKEETEPIILRYLETKRQEYRDTLILGHLWLAKDVICRFRAHWPETRNMTNDIASEAIIALTEFVNCFENWKGQQEFFNHCQWFIHARVRDYINNNRSAFSASTRTNQNRKANNEPLEYNFACEFNDELFGVNIDSSYMVEVCDSIEVLGNVDLEEIRDRVLFLLDTNHDVSEKDLTHKEKESLKKLIQYLERDI